MVHKTETGRVSEYEMDDDAMSSSSESGGVPLVGADSPSDKGNMNYCGQCHFGDDSSRTDNIDRTLADINTADAPGDARKWMHKHVDDINAVHVALKKASQLRSTKIDTEVDHASGNDMDVDVKTSSVSAAVAPTTSKGDSNYCGVGHSKVSEERAAFEEQLAQQIRDREFTDLCDHSLGFEGLSSNEWCDYHGGPRPGAIVSLCRIARCRTQLCSDCLPTICQHSKGHHRVSSGQCMWVDCTEINNLYCCDDCHTMSCKYHFQERCSHFSYTRVKFRKGDPDREFCIGIGLDRSVRSCYQTPHPELCRCNTCGLYMCWSCKDERTFNRKSYRKKILDTDGKARQLRPSRADRLKAEACGGYNSSGRGAGGAASRYGGRGGDYPDNRGSGRFAASDSRGPGSRRN